MITRKSIPVDIFIVTIIINRHKYNQSYSTLPVFVSFTNFLKAINTLSKFAVELYLFDLLSIILFSFPVPNVKCWFYIVIIHGVDLS